MMSRPPSERHVLHTYAHHNVASMQATPTRLARLHGPRRAPRTFRAPSRRSTCVCRTSWGQWTAHVAAYFEGAHAMPLQFHFAYLVLAGLGVPLSEDAFVVWIGATLSNGSSIYAASKAQMAACLAVVYVGVVLSDLVTFLVGVGLRVGLFRRMREALVKDQRSFDRAMAMVRKWGYMIGAVERFSLGFRGPLCIICGYVGVSSLQFFQGVCAGALITMPLQLAMGYALRNTASPYLAALAIVTGPNAVGHVIGPLLAGLGYSFAQWKAKKKEGKTYESTDRPANESSA